MKNYYSPNLLFRQANYFLLLHLFQNLPLTSNLHHVVSQANKIPDHSKKSMPQLGAPPDSPERALPTPKNSEDNAENSRRTPRKERCWKISTQNPTTPVLQLNVQNVTRLPNGPLWPLLAQTNSPPSLQDSRQESTQDVTFPSPRTSVSCFFPTHSTTPLPIDEDAPPSPNGIPLLFEEERRSFIGYESPPQGVQKPLDLMPRIRQIWLFLNVSIPSLSGKSLLSSGICSGADMVTQIFPALDSSLPTLIPSSTCTTPSVQTETSEMQVTFMDSVHQLLQQQHQQASTQTLILQNSKDMVAILRDLSTSLKARAPGLHGAEDT